MRKKRGSLIKISRFFALLGVLALSAAVLGGCGKDREEGQMGVDGCVYIVRGSTTLSMTGNQRFTGGYVYYTDGAFLKRVPVDAALLSGEEVPEGSFSNAGLEKDKTEIVYSGMGNITYAMDGDGNLYTFEFLSGSNDQYQAQAMGKKLVGTAADGASLYEADFNDAQELSYAYVDPENGAQVPIQSDGEGNVYVLMDGVIYVVDPQGKAAGQISTEECRREGDYKETLLCCQDGKVYYAAEGKRGVNSWEAWEIIHRDGYVLRSLDGFQIDSAAIISDGMMAPALISKDGFLYEYDPGTSSVRKVMSMDDSSLNTSDVKAVLRLNDDYLLTFNKESKRIGSGRSVTASGEDRHCSFGGEVCRADGKGRHCAVGKDRHCFFGGEVCRIDGKGRHCAVGERNGGTVFLLCRDLRVMAKISRKGKIFCQLGKIGIDIFPLW